MEQPTAPQPPACFQPRPPLPDDLAADVPLALATAAHAGTSHVPDTRGRQEVADYVATMLADWQALLQLADTPAKLVTLAEAWHAYRTGRRRRLLVYLGRRARCLSPMITGPARFPVARQVRANDSADAALHELVDHRVHTMARIRRQLQPGLGPIASGAHDAADALQAKLATLEAAHAQMLRVNSTIRRHARGGTEAQRAALNKAGIPDAVARAVLVPDYMGRVGFPDYAVRNSSAEIRRIKERIVAVAQAKATPDASTDGPLARMEDSPADNRVRLYYPGKPSPDVRDSLKAQGFRWAPSLGCWQAYRNATSVRAARALAGLP